MEFGRVTTELMEKHLNVWTIMLGGLLLVVVLINTFWGKDIRWGVYMLLLAVVFTGFENPVVHMFCYILRWLILALIAARLLVGRAQLRLSTVSILFFIWSGAALLSAFQAPSIFRGVVFGMVYFLCFFVFFVVALSEVTTEEQMNRWFKMFTFLGWTFVLFALAGFIADPRIFTSGAAAGRLRGGFANAMTIARNLVFAGTIFLWNGLQRKDRPFRQTVYYIMTLFCAYLIFLTGSRGALGGFAFTLAVFALHYRKRMALLIIPVLVMGGFYIVPKILAVAAHPFVTHMTTFETPQRPKLRALGVERFKKRPITGWGLGSLSDIKSPVVPGFVSLHNSYLNYLVEFGLPGFLIVMTVLLYTYFRAWRMALFEARTEYTRDAAWFMVANLTALFTWNYFDGALSNPARIHFYWLLILIALTECLVRINQQIEYEVEPEYQTETYQSWEEEMVHV